MVKFFIFTIFSSHLEGGSHSRNRISVSGCHALSFSGRKFLVFVLDWLICTMKVYY